MDEKIIAMNDSELSQVAGGVQTITCFEYTIKPGDNLSTLAAKYGTTVDMLVKLNNIADKNKIYAGKTLLIPVKK